MKSFERNRHRQRERSNHERAAGLADTTSSSESPQAGSRQRCFEMLVRICSAYLYRYAYWLCRDKALAEDLVQETFMRAWKSLDSLRDAKAARWWLITILRRENARRFERYRPKETNVDPDDLEAREPGCDTSTEAFVLRRAIAALPEAYREPLLLQVLGGYTCYEIAELLALSGRAVSTRLFRARQRLHAVLEDGEDAVIDRQLQPTV